MKILRIVLNSESKDETQLPEQYQFKLEGEKAYHFRLEKGTLQVYNYSDKNIVFYPLTSIRYFDIIHKNQEANNA